MNKSTAGIVQCENAMKRCCKGDKGIVSLFLLLLLATSIAAVSPTAFADDDENEDEEDEEREDGEELALGSGIPDVILYGTIIVIAGSAAYTGFKIYSARKPKMLSG